MMPLRRQDVLSRVVNIVILMNIWIVFDQIDC